MVYSQEQPLPNQPVEAACGTAECYCPRFATGEDGSSKDAHEWCSSKAVINGTMMPVVATFGMCLAGLVIRDVTALVMGLPRPGAEAPSKTSQRRLDAADALVADSDEDDS